MGCRQGSLSLHMQGSGVIGNSADGPQEIEGEPGLSLTLGYLPGVGSQQLQRLLTSISATLFPAGNTALFGYRGSECTPAQRPATATCPPSQISGSSKEMMSA